MSAFVNRFFPFFFRILERKTDHFSRRCVQISLHCPGRPVQIHSWMISFSSDGITPCSTLQEQHRVPLRSRSRHLHSDRSRSASDAVSQKIELKANTNGANTFETTLQFPRHPKRKAFPAFHRHTFQDKLSEYKTKYTNTTVITNRHTERDLFKSSIPLSTKNETKISEN